MGPHIDTIQECVCVCVFACVHLYFDDKWTQTQQQLHLDQGHLQIQRFSPHLTLNMPKSQIYAPQIHIKSIEL